MGYEVWASKRRAEAATSACVADEEGCLFCRSLCRWSATGVFMVRTKMRANVGGSRSGQNQRKSAQRRPKPSGQPSCQTLHPIPKPPPPSSGNDCGPPDLTTASWAEQVVPRPVARHRSRSRRARQRRKEPIWPQQTGHPGEKGSGVREEGSPETPLGPKARALLPRIATRKSSRAPGFTRKTNVAEFHTKRYCLAMFSMTLALISFIILPGPLEVREAV